MMTIPVYPERQFLTLNVLAIVIIIFIEFDYLTHFKKICRAQHSLPVTGLPLISRAVIVTDQIDIFQVSIIGSVKILKY